MKTVSIVTPCYNEEDNVLELADRIRGIMAALPDVAYEHLFIDNCSTDRTVERLRQLAATDACVKVIVNARNFGHIRSPYHALFQARGDAVVVMAADFQDPPDLIPAFIARWNEGYKIVVGIKSSSMENPLLYFLRGVYYKIIRRFSTVDLLEQFSGYGLYDRKVVDILAGLREPYPYFRGLISDIGYTIARIEYTQPVRKHGRTKNDFYTLFDMALLGFTNYTKIPLRLATMLGFVAAGISFLIGVVYLIAKLIFWNNFSAGMAPLLIGFCFIGSVQLFFLGIVGEYVGAIFTYVQNRPLVVEKERINFDDAADTKKS